MQTLPRFPNVEQVACDLLNDLAPTYTKLPPDFQTPAIRIKGLGGPTDLHQYFARCDVEVFSTDYGQAWDLAGDAAQIILAVYRQTVNGILVDSGDVPNGLQSPFYSQDITRVQFEATLVLRRSVT